MITVCFIGYFKNENLHKKFENEYSYTFIDHCENINQLIGTFDFVFSTNFVRDCVIYWHDIETPIVIKVIKGTVEKCAEALLYFCSGMIGIDMADVCSGLSFGKRDSTFYGTIKLEEIKNYSDCFKFKDGILLKIYIPETDETTSLEDIDRIINEIHALCNEKTYFVCNVDSVSNQSELIYDLFISGVDIEVNKEYDA